ncbi:MAG: twin-arginine translocase TatA/TatE family subunit [Ilumatobacter sp.]|uniref:twin-arginine translocase TatA/TatE family subunit n=1 Tax=Ilumatobacter sp. TaxID=1967498 RepID=UPI003299D2C2
MCDTPPENLAVSNGQHESTDGTPDGGGSRDEEDAVFGSGEMVVVLAMVVLLFGSSRIPKLARNLGIAQRELKDALRGDEPDAESADTESAAAAVTADAEIVRATTEAPPAPDRARTETDTTIDA